MEYLNFRQDLNIVNANYLLHKAISEKVQRSVLVHLLSYPQTALY
jgi:hypothetical protein